MSEVFIKRVEDIDDEIGEFINREFTGYGIDNGIVLNYDEFCFAARDSGGDLAGAITGRAYYDEVHIGDLIVGKDHRRSGLGRKLVMTVEDEYRGRGYNVVTLTTFGFQAPGFYEKLGYELELRNFLYAVSPQELMYAEALLFTIMM